MQLRKSLPVDCCGGDLFDARSYVVGAVSPLVDGVSEGPQQADSKAFDPLIKQLPERIPHLIVIESRQHFAGDCDPFAQTANAAFWHQGLRRLGVDEVHRLQVGNSAGAANGTTGDLQGVLDSPCRQQADPRSFALDQGIGANGRAVGEADGPCQQIGQGKLLTFCHLREYINDALFQPGRNGKGCFST
ncbi:MAG: hypothetical protein O6918_16350 [Deltaproteobacteria bacterium]|nr:hypothetical protein [Deltaproteobacteria bacterium]